MPRDTQRCLRTKGIQPLDKGWMLRCYLTLPFFGCSFQHLQPRAIDGMSRHWLLPSVLAETTLLHCPLGSRYDLRTGLPLHSYSTHGIGTPIHCTNGYGFLEIDLTRTKISKTRPVPMNIAG